MAQQDPLKEEDIKLAQKNFSRLVNSEKHRKELQESLSYDMLQKKLKRRELNFSNIKEINDKEKMKFDYLMKRMEFRESLINGYQSAVLEDID